MGQRSRVTKKVGMDNHDSDCTLGEWYGECIGLQPRLFDVSAAEIDA